MTTTTTTTSPTTTNGADRPPRIPRGRRCFQAPRFLPALAVLAVFHLAVGIGCDVTLHVGRNGETGAGGDGTNLGPDGGAAGGASGATGGTFVPPVRTPPDRHAPLTSTSKLDLLFMIDDSASMAPLQAKMRVKIPQFMDVLKNLPGGMPDLHLAVVSSSLGAGEFSNVAQCEPGTQGNGDGLFKHSSACTQLNPGETFLKSSIDASGARVENFKGGDITPVFDCLASLGDQGCGFEHQFESVRLALQRSLTVSNPPDPNAGFLRSDAYLAIVMLTNEDDCSVPYDSDLFDPSMQTLADPLGGLQSYRCNEFGHKCDQPLPHGAAGLPMTLTGCESKEDGRLVTVNGFIDFLFSLKPMHPERIFVAAIAGPTTPYTITSHLFMLGNGDTESQPAIQHSCTSGMQGSEYADPAVRVQQWTQAFGPNSYFGNICSDDLGLTMSSIAERMVGP